MLFSAPLLTALAAPQPNWPNSFIANFTENFKADGFRQNSTGFYALDLGFDGGKGAQAIFRSGAPSACSLMLSASATATRTMQHHLLWALPLFPSTLPHTFHRCVLVVLDI